MRSDEHRVPLAEGFSLWREHQVRGAGFSVELIGGLTAPDCAAAADAVLDEEAAVERAFTDAMTSCSRAIGDAEGEQRAQLIRRLRKLRDGKLVDGVVEPALAKTSLDDTRGRFFRAWAADQTRWKAAIRRVAANPSFREAVAWQNRAMIADGLDALLRQPSDADDRRTRTKEQTVVRYAQRYCMKNDTIGFFGPIGWGRIVDGVARISLKAGEALCATHRVHFEPWAVRALGSTFDALEEVRIGLAPRLCPHLWIEKGKLCGLRSERSADGRRVLDDKELAVLSRCDGRKGALEIARAVSRRQSRQMEVLSLLVELEQRGWIRWAIDVPAVAFPEERLRAAFEAIRFPAVRERALSALDEIEAARNTLGEARGDDVRVGSALDALERRFTELTRAAPTRSAGRTYAGRTLVYLDCRRDIDFALGSEIVRRVAAPLSLILLAARWYTFEVGRRHEALFADIYGRSAHGDRLNLAEFWETCGDHLVELTPPIFAEVNELLHQRMADLLQPGGTPRQHLSSELRARFLEAFDAPHPGWPSARHHSPDVMIAARGLESIHRDDYTLVLGELHAGLNVFSTISATHQHPDRTRLERAFAADIARGIAPVAVDDFTRSSHDSRLAVDDFHIETVPEVSSWRGADRVLRLSDLEVYDSRRGLRCRARRGKHDFHIMQVMERPLKIRTALNFSLLPRQAHAARITIDDLVVARESWRLMPETLHGLEHAEASQRFLSVRRLARSLGLPRHVFVRSPAEVKPVYVDLDAPALVELFARMAKGAAHVDISEMLPSPQQTWLPDAAGRKHTCELRLVAVDPCEFPSDDA